MPHGRGRRRPCHPDGTRRRPSVRWPSAVAFHRIKGRWALPGGFVLPDEDLDGRPPGGSSARRPAYSKYPATSSSWPPTGSPRTRPEGAGDRVAYLAMAPDLPVPSAGKRRGRPPTWLPVDRLIGHAGLRPRPDPDRRRRAGPGQARVHAAGRSVLRGDVHRSPSSGGSTEARFGESSSTPGTSDRKVTTTKGFVRATGHGADEGWRSTGTVVPGRGYVGAPPATHAVERSIGVPIEAHRCRPIHCG